MSIQRVLGVLTLFLVTLLPATLFAQTAGAITGTVHDSTGGAVPGATIRITNTVTNRVVELTTDERGSFRT
jgi:hypothetical protein